MSWMAMPHRYSQCAVVSSSGVLRKHQHGESISDADMVMRFNNAPTQGFEDLVGGGTTFRVVNEKLLMNWLNGTDLALLSPGVTFVSTCSICNVGEAQLVNVTELKRRRQDVHSLFPTINMYTSNLEVEAELDTFFKREYMSSGRHRRHEKSSPAGVTTGSMGMALALSICDEVKAYGMAQSSTDVVPYNYYDAESTSRKTNLWHRSWTAEKALWRRLAVNSEADIDATDVAVIPGFSKVPC